MRRLVVRDLRHLRRVLGRRIGDAQVVSFDIFDTLLARRIEPPEAVHQAVARHLAEALGHDDAESVLKARYEEERKLREEAATAGLDFECHYDEILQRWIGCLAGDPDPELAARIRELELELEGHALVAKPGAVEVLEWLRGEGKQTIAVSDMYLGEGNVTELLRGAGLLELLDRVVVSADSRLCKYSGRLFDRVLEEHDLEPRQLIHVGDNRVSDYQAPRRRGIPAVHLRERRDGRRRRRLRRSGTLARMDRYWRGHHLLEVARSLTNPPAEAEQGFYYHYGYEVLGPVYFAYTLGIIERILEVEPRKTVFVARDGYLFHRLFHVLWPALSGRAELPEHEYIYLSRRTGHAALAAEGLTRERALVGLYNPSQQGLYSILRVYALPPEAFEDLAREHGFEEIREPLKDWKDPRLERFLADPRVQARIQEYGGTQRDLMERYLEGVGFFGDGAVALVDIGWNGTIQSVLEQTYGAREDFPELFGLYFGFVAGIPHPFGPANHVEGLVYDERRRIASERVCLAFEELFEESARASEASTVGYREHENGRVEPVLKADSEPDRQEELQCNPLIRDLQAGIEDAVRDLIPAQRLTGYTFSDIKPYMVTLVERAVAYPTREEIEHLTRITHAEDFGYDTTMDMAKVRFNKLSLGQWRRLPTHLRRSNWRYATAATAGIPRSLFRLLELWRR